MSSASDSTRPGAMSTIKFLLVVAIVMATVVLPVAEAQEGLMCWIFDIIVGDIFRCYRDTAGQICRVVVNNIFIPLCVLDTD